jgi:hypothetical protein
VNPAQSIVNASMVQDSFLSSELVVCSGPRGRNVHWLGISGCRLSQVRPGPAVSLGDYSFLGALSGRYVNTYYLGSDVVPRCCLIHVVTRPRGSKSSPLAILGWRLGWHVLVCGCVL